MVGRRLTLQQDRDSNLNRLVQAGVATGAIRIDAASKEIISKR